MVRVLLIVVVVALAIYAEIDCMRTPEEDIPKGIPRPLWMLFILIFTGIGPLAWILISWAAKAERESTDGRIRVPKNPLEIFRKTPKEKPKKAPLPPDENEDFLFQLEAEVMRRKLAEERQAREAEKKHSSSREKNPSSSNSSDTSKTEENSTSSENQEEQTKDNNDSAEN